MACIMTVEQTLIASLRALRSCAASCTRVAAAPPDLAMGGLGRAYAAGAKLPLDGGNPYLPDILNSAALRSPWGGFTVYEAHFLRPIALSPLSSMPLVEHPRPQGSPQMPSRFDWISFSQISSLGSQTSATRPELGHWKSSPPHPPLGPRTQI